MYIVSSHPPPPPAGGYMRSETNTSQMLILVKIPSIKEAN